MQHDQEEPRQPDTARACAKDLIRSYVLDGWTSREISKGHMAASGPDYRAQVGATSGYLVDHQGQRRSVNNQQVIVTQMAETPCWAVFHLLELMAEIKDEAKGYRQISIDDIFMQEEERRREEEEAEEVLRRAAQPPAPRKPPAVFRAYQGGWCKHCGKELGYIEADGGRDREYCDNGGKCRVAYHRAKKREEQRQQVLHYNAELRKYWYFHGIRGEVLLRLQEILLQHGKAAAKAATNAVLVALAAAEQAGSSEQQRLIEEVMLGGEKIGFEEIRLEDFRIPAGVGGWSEFVSNASANFLRSVRGYLYDRQYQEEYKAAARRRLEKFSRDLAVTAGQTGSDPDNQQED